MSPACSLSSDTKTVEIRGQQYTFPSSERRAVVADQGQLLVRVKPRGAPFQLIFNTRSDRQQQETGNLVISGVSDQFSDFEQVQSPVGTILCKDVPYWGCGFALMDGKARWSVVFNRDQIPNATVMQKEALRLLRGYRGDQIR
jgi:hypothetical protein